MAAIPEFPMFFIIIDFVFLALTDPISNINMPR